MNADTGDKVLISGASCPSEDPCGISMCVGGECELQRVAPLREFTYEANLSPYGVIRVFIENVGCEPINHTVTVTMECTLDTYNSTRTCGLVMEAGDTKGHITMPPWHDRIGKQVRCVISYSDDDEEYQFVLDGPPYRREDSPCCTFSISKQDNSVICSSISDGTPCTIRSRHADRSDTVGVCIGGACTKEEEEEEAQPCEGKATGTPCTHQDGTEGSCFRDVCSHVEVLVPVQMPIPEKDDFVRDGDPCLGFMGNAGVYQGGVCVLNL